MLRVAQLVCCTETEGPGRRFAVWTQGCSLGCPGCCNPEMLPFVGGELWPVERLARRVLETRGIEGVTLLGGEPMAQAGACAELCARVRREGLSVMLFSGYTLAALTAPGADPAWAHLLALTDLLVDGRFEREQPERRRRWIGSANQLLHFLTDRYQPQQPCFSAPNSLEIRLDGRGELSVNGWPDLARRLAR